MRSIALLIMSLSITVLAACDTTDQMHKPRTMVIGGMPAHDQDYKLPTQPEPSQASLGE